MHRSHFTGCVIGIALVTGLIFFGGVPAGTVGLVMMALVCPISMIMVMKILGGGHGSADSCHHEAPRKIDDLAEVRSDTRAH